MKVVSSVDSTLQVATVGRVGERQAPVTTRRVHVVAESRAFLPVNNREAAAFDCKKKMRFEPRSERVSTAPLRSLETEAAECRAGNSDRSNVQLHDWKFQQVLRVVFQR
jgi:hypothetical protein